MRPSRLIKAILSCALVLGIFSCQKPSEGTGIITRPPSNKPTGDIPDYDDYYVDISGWDNHEKWNLANVHDPSIAYYNGYYYMYNTDASYGNEHLKATTGRHFPGKRSRDLVNWTYIPGPMNDAPAWVADSLNSIRKRMNLMPISTGDINYGYWAPCVRSVTVNGETKLRMYYCIVIDNLIKTGGTGYDGSWGERAFIGMCESTDPANGNWEDKGYVICSSSDKGRDGWTRNGTGDWEGYFYYNAIDPTYYIDEASGRHYLIYGSWHSGFALVELDPETGKTVNELGDPWADTAADLTARYGVRVGTRTLGSRWQGSEAPELVYNDGYYWLFMAYDGLDVPYNTRVVRAEKIEGPYYDITGRNFTNGRGDCYPIVTHPYAFKDSDGWVGISHCCIFQDEVNRDWFYASQGRLPAGINGNAYSNALMMGHVRRLVWVPKSPEELDNLWPIALPERYAGLEDSKVSRSELVGIWEHINLAYSYGQQQTSAQISLREDGTMVGALSGEWSYDEETGYLNLGGNMCVVKREADWEASPRVATIVYAGIENTGTQPATLWGKKQQ